MDLGFYLKVSSLLYSQNLTWWKMENAQSFGFVIYRTLSTCVG